MKKLKIPSFFILLLTLSFSCNTSDEVTPTITEDSDLLEAIQSSTDLLEISADVLPSSAKSVLDENYQDEYVSNAYIASNLGYKVNLRQEKGSEVGTLSQVYFDLNGRELTTDQISSSNRRAGERGRRRGKRDCFDIVFPVSLTMPDGSTISLNSADDWTLVRRWYENNPDAEAGRPEFVFPIDIVFEDDSQVTIQNTEQLLRAKASCRNDKPDDRPERERCFIIDYPYSVTMPDSTQITLEGEGDRALIRAWYENNPDFIGEKPGFVYPINLVYADGEELLVYSNEELQDAREACREDRRPRPCFRLAYPYSVTMPDDSQITLNSAEDKVLIRTWYQDNPGHRGEKPELVFPVEIVYQDGESITINNQEELRIAREECSEEE